MRAQIGLITMIAAALFVATTAGIADDDTWEVPKDKTHYADALFASGEADSIIFRLQKVEKLQCVKFSDIPARNRLLNYATAVAHGYKNAIGSYGDAIGNAEAVQQFGYHEVHLQSLVSHVLFVYRIRICDLRLPPDAQSAPH